MDSSKLSHCGKVTHRFPVIDLGFNKNDNLGSPNISVVKRVEDNKSQHRDIRPMESVKRNDLIQFLAAKNLSWMLPDLPKDLTLEDILCYATASQTSKPQIRCPPNYMKILIQAVQESTKDQLAEFNHLDCLETAPDQTSPTFIRNDNAGTSSQSLPVTTSIRTTDSLRNSPITSPHLIADDDSQGHLRRLQYNRCRSASVDDQVLLSNEFNQRLQLNSPPLQLYYCLTPPSTATVLATGQSQQQECQGQTSADPAASTRSDYNASHRPNQLHLLQSSHPHPQQPHYYHYQLQPSLSIPGGAVGGGVPYSSGTLSNLARMKRNSLGRSAPSILTHFSTTSAESPPPPTRLRPRVDSTSHRHHHHHHHPTASSLRQQLTRHHHGNHTSPSSSNSSCSSSILPNQQPLLLECQQSTSSQQQLLVMVPPPTTALSCSSPDTGCQLLGAGSPCTQQHYDIRSTSTTGGAPGGQQPASLALVGGRVRQQQLSACMICGSLVNFANSALVTTSENNRLFLRMAEVGHVTDNRRWSVTSLPSSSGYGTNTPESLGNNSFSQASSKDNINQQQQGSPVVQPTTQVSAKSETPPTATSITTTLPRMQPQLAQSVSRSGSIRLPRTSVHSFHPSQTMTGQQATNCQLLLVCSACYSRLTVNGGDQAAPGSPLSSQRHFGEGDSSSPASSLHAPSPVSGGPVSLSSSYRVGGRHPNLLAALRTRSRSLSSNRSMGCQEELHLLNDVYIERFPKASAQMEAKLRVLVEKLEHQDTVSWTAVARFVHTQIVQSAKGMLDKALQRQLNCYCFYEVTENLQKLIEDTRTREPESLPLVINLIRDLLLIIARPARLLECIEFGLTDYANQLTTTTTTSPMATNIDRRLPHSETHGNTLSAAVMPYLIDKLGTLPEHHDQQQALEQYNDWQPAPVYSRQTSSSLSAASSNHPASAGCGNECHSPSLLLRRSLSISAVESALSSTSSSFDQLTDSPTNVNTASPRSPLPSRPACEADFIVLKLISNGAYGAVYLVRDRATRQRFALKKINKKHLTLRNQVDQVFAERDIMSFVDNPFVVSLWCTFETRKCLCIVMEYVEGGDCAFLLKSINGPFSLDVAKHFFAETVLALEYLHAYGIVHRDLKPDNLLITQEGHIKLTDFGLSRIGLMNMACNVYEQSLSLSKDCQMFHDRQVFGTPEYIAPEVILRQDYGKPVDWWSMGIILYQFLVGCVPFYGETIEELFSEIVSGEIEWPEEEECKVNDDAVTLILHLLERDPLKRLGSVSGAVEIKESALFLRPHPLDWANLLRQKTSFVPRLDHDEDTSYFDPRDDRYNHELEGDEDISPPSSRPESPQIRRLRPSRPSRKAPQHRRCSSLEVVTGSDSHFRASSPLPISSGSSGRSLEPPVQPQTRSLSPPHSFIMTKQLSDSYSIPPLSPQPKTMQGGESIGPLNDLVIDTLTATSGRSIASTLHLLEQETGGSMTSFAKEEAVVSDVQQDQDDNVEDSSTACFHSFASYSPRFSMVSNGDRQSRDLSTSSSVFGSRPQSTVVINKSDALSRQQSIESPESPPVLSSQQPPPLSPPSLLSESVASPDMVMPLILPTLTPVDSVSGGDETSPPVNNNLPIKSSSSQSPKTSHCLPEPVDPVPIQQVRLRRPRPNVLETAATIFSMDGTDQSLTSTAIQTNQSQATTKTSIQTDQSHTTTTVDQSKRLSSSSSSSSSQQSLSAPTTVEGSGSPLLLLRSISARQAPPTASSRQNQKPCKQSVASSVEAVVAGGSRRQSTTTKPATHRRIIKRGPSGYGFNFRTVTTTPSRRGHHHQGRFMHIVRDVDPLGSAWQAGLRNDDLLVAVNDANVTSEHYTEVIRLLLQSGRELTLITSSVGSGTSCSRHKRRANPYNIQLRRHPGSLRSNTHRQATRRRPPALVGCEGPSSCGGGVRIERQTSLIDNQPTNWARQHQPPSSSSTRFVDSGSSLIDRKPPTGPCIVTNFGSGGQQGSSSSNSSSSDLRPHHHHRNVIIARHLSASSSFAANNEDPSYRSPTIGEQSPPYRHTTTLSLTPRLVGDCQLVVRPSTPPMMIAATSCYCGGGVVVEPRTGSAPLLPRPSRPSSSHLSPSPSSTQSRSVETSPRNSPASSLLTVSVRNPPPIHRHSTGATVQLFHHPAPPANPSDNSSSTTQ